MGATTWTRCDGCAHLAPSWSPGPPGVFRVHAGRTGTIARLVAGVQAKVDDGRGLRSSAAATFDLEINGIGGHLVRDHALGEIGTVALQALQRRWGWGRAAVSS
jgi:hypothetical protein